MVFANLQEREKDAFFSLLDEYFQSRPDIFAALSGQGGASSSNSGNKSATNATLGQRLFSAAPAMAAASKPRFSGGSFSGGGTGNAASSQVQEQQQEDSQPVAGRVAAAAAAFAQHRTMPSTGSSPNLGSSAPSRLSGMDMSALKNVLVGRAGQTGPPPSFNKTGAAAPPPPVARRQPEPEPEPEPETQEEAQGEWARALYDYDSNEPGDLNIKENQHILVTERSSDDWWMGEVDGKSGLFPASYAELL
ncbi:hypothetical protein APHAL10511_005634 [Amanita phalloides]|nr:hypothetical protein APHAL10511_005634 [Amanita phalloides]